VEVAEPRDGAIETRSHWHEGELDLSEGSGWVLFTDLEILWFRISLENFLRVAFANLLIRRDGCLLHAAGIVRDEEAYAFFGLSGAGKSTVTKLSRPSPALSDDLIALTLRGSRLIAERVPFYGVYPPTERAGGRYPVRALLRLVKAEGHRLEEIPPSRQLLHLRSCMPFLNPASGAALDLAEKIVAAVPVRELHFARNAGFWELF
jgi:hypothetical protein